MHSNSCEILRRAAFDYTEIDILHYKIVAEQKSERLSLVCFICMLFPVESDQYVRENDKMDKHYKQTVREK